MLFQGEMVTATQPLTDEMIELYAMELGAQVRLVDPGQEEETILMARYIGADEEIPQEDLEPRGPVVTVMGHVDHGKTLLLDRIRSSNVVAGESGGITQHIGAYQVAVGSYLVTFIDTPGHEAFTAMRARGAQVTDTVVLVVAADDGVMQQTVEAIDHARSAEVPIIVAINKIDRPEADVNRTMQQLSEHGIIPEAWGGDTVICEISALDGTGIDDLLDHIVLVAELEDLKSTPKGRAVAVVLEANLDPGKGPVATAVVKRGTLKVGDSIVAGAAWGKVKALVDFTGKSRKSAGPSTPVQVLGFSRPPAAGDTMFVTQDTASAKSMGEAVERRERVTGRIATAVSTGVKLEDIFEQIQSGIRATLNLIVKADGQGTLQAVLDSLEKLEREEVAINFLHKGVGGITESDVQLAIASNATIIGFNVRPDRRSRELAESRDVDIRTYEVIYKLIEDVESAVVGMLTPEIEENVTGEAEVREVFRVPRVGAVAGCYVRDGVITRGSKVRFLRDGVVIWNGSISSLRRFKEDVRVVQSGFECGIGLSGYQDLKPGDIIETYEEVPVERS
jgi:translation initiation factor IF-2